MNKKDSDNLIITNISELEASHKAEYNDYEYYKYKIPKSFEESRLQVAIYEIPPKKAGYPYHYHLRNEEVFYILDGTGLLQSGEKSRIVSKGDIIICPPCEKGAHILTNTSEKEVLTYFEVDVSYYPEVIVYPNSNKIGILENEESKIFFRRSTEVDYYD